MKAVNLIPDEQRRGAGGTSGRSGGVAFVVIGLLAGIVALVAVYAMTNATIKTRRSKLQSLQAQVANSQKTNSDLAVFTALATERKERVDTVQQIAASRFDWAGTLREITRVLPKNVWLESMSGTVTPTTTVNGSGTGVPNEPQIDIQGCTASQGEVAQVMTALQLMAHADQVDLTKSAKSDSPSSGSGSCTVNTAYPAFDITVSFHAPGTDGASAAPATATPVTSNTPATALGGSTGSATAAPPAAGSSGVAAG